VLADSRSILATSDGELVDLLAGGQGVFNVLPLSGVVSELEAAIVELTAAAPAPAASGSTPDARHPAAAYLAAGGSVRR
jgi:hypothetical protein